MTMSNYVRLAFREDASRPSPVQILSTRNYRHVETICEDCLDQWLGDRKPRATSRPYALRQLIVCGLCGRRMQGSWIAGRARYRCRYPNEYGLANQVQHPSNIYVREDAILPQLDAWLARLFDPDNVDATVTALAAADGDDTTRAQIERAKRTLANCKQRLAHYRAALEAGTDPAVIAKWSAEVQAEQARAENDLQRARQAQTPPPAATNSRTWSETPASL